MNTPHKLQSTTKFDTNFRAKFGEYTTQNLENNSLMNTLHKFQNATKLGEYTTQTLETTTFDEYMIQTLEQSLKNTQHKLQKTTKLDEYTKETLEYQSLINTLHKLKSTTKFGEYTTQTRYQGIMLQEYKSVCIVVYTCTMFLIQPKSVCIVCIYYDSYTAHIFVKSQS